jgi:hypothetical protein
MEKSEEAQASVQFPTFSHADSIGPFSQSANREQSESECFGLSVSRLSEEKRTQQPENLCENLCIRQVVEASNDRKATASSQLSLIDSPALLGARGVRYFCVAVSGTPDLAPLQVQMRVKGIYRRFRVLRQRVTDNATPSVKSLIFPTSSPTARTRTRMMWIADGRSRGQAHHSSQRQHPYSAHDLHGFIETAPARVEDKADCVKEHTERI